MLLAPTGALIVMMCQYRSTSNFFSSVFTHPIDVGDDRCIRDTTAPKHVAGDKGQNESQHQHALRGLVLAKDVLSQSLELCKAVLELKKGLVR